MPSRKTKDQLAEIEAEKTKLREYLPIGAEILCSQRAYNRRSGSSRWSLHVVHKGELLRLTYSIGLVTDYRVNSECEMLLGFVNMDPLMNVIEALGYALYPDRAEPKSCNRCGGGGDVSVWNPDSHDADHGKWISAPCDTCHGTGKQTAGPGSSFKYRRI